MFTRFLILILCVGISLFSALAVRSELQLNELNGVQLFSVFSLTFDLHYAINRGINFGFAGNEDIQRQFMLAGLALIVSIMIFIWSWRNGRVFTMISGGFFAGGGLANAYERVAFGGVFDYLNISTTFYRNPYSFNLADIYIFIGAVIIILAPNHRGGKLNAIANP